MKKNLCLLNKFNSNKNYKSYVAVTLISTNEKAVTLNITLIIIVKGLISVSHKD